MGLYARRSSYAGGKSQSSLLGFTINGQSLLINGQIFLINGQ